ncbi:hypothetical protein M405DRAFT_865239 [Rhizopogon salebrosus TDB-379]|nr:hypothetical protein M405DRAFT_865239 [Rhizopogon salebrosus TDB-379]
MLTARFRPLQKLRHKELEKLLKAQKAAEAAKEEAKKKATHKRSAAMLEEERAHSKDEPSSPAPSCPISHARKLPHILSPPPDQRKVLNSVTDVLNHNASGDEEGGLLSRVDAGPDAEEDMDAAVGSEGEVEKDDRDGEQVGKKKSIMEDQEETCTSSSTTSKWKAKVTLSEFSTPRIHWIAQLGNRDMRRLGALEEAFPSSTYKEDRCWETLTHACKPHAHLNLHLKELDGDSAAKDMLIIYAWQGLGCMRAELMVKARQRAPSWFGLTDLDLGEDVVSSCQWLLQENCFLYGGINLKERTYDIRKNPWAI